jgi:hypothetical protein
MSSRTRKKYYASLPKDIEASMVEFGSPLEFPGPYIATRTADTIGSWVVCDSRGDKLLSGSETATKLAAAAFNHLFNSLKAEGKIEGA